MAHASTSPKDFQATLNLPFTKFPLKHSALIEHAIIQGWQRKNIYEARKTLRAGEEIFILHDGPPYANGDLHVGHMMGKTLKDVIVRGQFMAGKDVSFVLGWDCHGLPIEWKVEENLRAEGIDKNVIAGHIFREKCRTFAAEWIAIHKESFKAMGIVADYQRSYHTMDHDYEAKIASALLTLLKEGYLYQGVKPVLWSIAEETALAEAEVEYHDVTSTAIYAAFPCIKRMHGSQKTYAVIWTTTPWTLPANRALACNAELWYAEIAITAYNKESPLQQEVCDASTFLVGENCLGSFCQAAGIESYTIVGSYKGKELEEWKFAHPLHNKGYQSEVPLYCAPWVSAETGTGIVHIAPAHGLEDYALAIENNLPIPQIITEKGTYKEATPLLGSKSIFNVETFLLEALTQESVLVASHKLRHSYPHSWRSKQPLIYRATNQWFIALDHHNGAVSLREKALDAIKKVKWIPSSSKIRIEAMVQGRPDWCISRQRTWGVPIPFVVDTRTGKAITHPLLLERTQNLIQRDGIEGWWNITLEDLLEGILHEDRAYLKKVYDCVDVWVDAGLSHHIILPSLGDDIADLYLEGSDQHRGWFQASLLLSCALHHRAPYKTVLTHGFTLDEHGYKMSKSLGNIIGPEELITKYGLDTVRLWIILSDVLDDIRVGHTVLTHTAEVYRRLRNTFRFLLAVLQPHGKVSSKWDPHIHDDTFATWPLLEQGILHQLSIVEQAVMGAIEEHMWGPAVQAIHHFCATDLSAFFFDIRKDVLYCDEDTPKRAACLATLQAILHSLLRWLAPVTSVLCDEVWATVVESEGNNVHASASVHLEKFISLPSKWHQPLVAEKLYKARAMRRTVNGALEKARTEGVIKSSLQAQVTLFWTQENPLSCMEESDFEEWAIVSKITFINAQAPQDSFALQDVPGINVHVSLAEGMKCNRCWKIRLEAANSEGLCARCLPLVNKALLSA